jgi:hypothetical protein
MKKMNETPEEAIKRLRREGASGTLTVHFANGRPRECEFLNRWRVPPPDQETVDLTETKAGR